MMGEGGGLMLELAVFSSLRLEAALRGGGVEVSGLGGLQEKV